VFSRLVLHLHSNHPYFREQANMIKLHGERPKIKQQFSDLKRKLSTIADEEWEGIPEVGTLTKKKRRCEETRLRSSGQHTHWRM
jgi:hypothetical protein